jgi:DNA-binding XRE family transcriptional regulator
LAREDAGVSQRTLARLAGLGASSVSEVEAGGHEPTIEVLARMAAALGGELSVRFYPGTGPLVRDHLQLGMTEALLGGLHGSWSPRPEVHVHTPVRGVVDVVLTNPVLGTIVACEAHSELRRVEQQLRWASAKAAGLEVVPPGLALSRLLLLRSTRHNRQVAAAYREVLTAAYPARHADAVDSLLTGTPWPGAAIVWADLEGAVATIRELPPRGVLVGR